MEGDGAARSERERARGREGGARSPHTALVRASERASDYSGVLAPRVRVVTCQPRPAAAAAAAAGNERHLVTLSAVATASQRHQIKPLLC